MEEETQKINEKLGQTIERVKKIIEEEEKIGKEIKGEKYEGKSPTKTKKS